MSWQLFTLVSVLSLSLSVLLQRVLLHKDKLNPYAYAVTFQGLVGILLLCFAVPHGLKLPGISKVALPAAISILTFGLGHILYAKTLELVEASAFSVLFATQAIWIMLLGIFWFHESLTPVQLLGTLLIFSSVGLLTKKWGALKLDRGTSLGLLTGLIFGIAITFWSYVGRHTDAMSWAALSFIGTSFASLMFRPSTRHQLVGVIKGKTMPKLLLLGVLYGLGSLTMLYAYRKGAFSIVTPLRQTSIIVTTLLALIILPAERLRIQVKVIAAIITFAGVVLIIS